jgi:hypothetical protein
MRGLCLGLVVLIACAGCTARHARSRPPRPTVEEYPLPAAVPQVDAPATPPPAPTPPATSLPAPTRP